MTAPIRIALMGCQGRMGKALLEAIQNNNQVALGAALERPGSTVIGLDVGDLNGLGAMNVLVADDLEKVKDQSFNQGIEHSKKVSLNSKDEL